MNYQIISNYRILSDKSIFTGFFTLSSILSNDKKIWLRASVGWGIEHFTEYFAKHSLGQVYLVICLRGFLERQWKHLFIQCQDIGTSKCLYMQHTVIYLCCARNVLIVYCQYWYSKKLHFSNTDILRNQSLQIDKLKQCVENSAKK